MNEFDKIETIDKELRIIQTKSLMISSLQEGNHLDKMVQPQLKTGEDFINYEYLDQIEQIDDSRVDDECFCDDKDTMDPTMSYYKEKVQEKIVDDLEFYQQLYLIPPVHIQSRDWNILFDIIYEFYVERNIEEKFLTDMTKLNRYSVAKSLLFCDCFLGIGTYIESLDYLECYEISQEDIAQLQEKLNGRNSGLEKIIDFNKFRNKSGSG